MKLQFVKVRFINQQKEGGNVVEANGIRAKIEFYDESARLLLRMDGRWDSSKHPLKLGPGESFNDLLRMNFGVEEEQNVDVAFWNPDNRQFVAFNNDSYCCFACATKDRIEIIVIATYFMTCSYLLFEKLQLTIQEVGPGLHHLCARLQVLRIVVSGGGLVLAALQVSELNLDVRVLVAEFVKHC